MTNAGRPKLEPRQLLSGPPAAGPLPPAVSARVAEQEWSSELLMRIVQLGIVLAFGTLYFISPRTDAMTSFSLVPAALGIYVVLTVIGLLWAWRRRIPDWAAYLSILFDMGLLMVLIWSFHRQYAQPPSFYLKAPTFLYVFIFIALRALRFEPKFVIAAGCCAILSWLVMVLVVLITDEPGMVVTRDYVRYLTSNSLLIGAEVDKLLAVAVVTVVLAVALRRARALLLYSVTESAAAENLARFFDRPVASQIRDSADLGSQGARRQAAVAFFDLRGFTQFSAPMEPRLVMEILGEYQSRIIAAVRTEGGIIDKFLGDGVMATFGAAEDSSTYAADALRAIDAVMAESATWAQLDGPLGHLPAQAVCAAAAAGPVIFGVVGDGDRLEFTVIGPPVNLAAKLEKCNKVVGSRALTTAETYRLAIEQGYAPGRDVAVQKHDVESVGPNELAVLHP